MLQSLIDQFSYPWNTENEGKAIDWLLAAGILMCGAFLWNTVLIALLGEK